MGPTLTCRENLGITTVVPLYPKTSAGLREYTVEEVSAHCSEDDAWIIIDEHVYDVTRFVPRHPGGKRPLINLAGCDATDAFANYHSAKVYASMLPSFLIGKVVPGEIIVPAHVKAFREVRQELLRLGLFQTEVRFYAKLCVWYVSLFVTSFYLSLACSNTWLHMCGAGVMGLFWQQLAGLGHDLGHSAVTHDFWKDHFLGSSLTALMGLSLSWWKIDHNTHHVVTNSLDRDPNVQHLPVLAITDKIFRNRFYDLYHRKWIAFDHLSRLFVARQHIYFYPLMLVARWNLYAEGIAHLIFSEEVVHFRRTEVVGVAIFFSWLFALSFSMDTNVEAVCWLFVSHAAAGMLHVQIVLSHWAFETYFGRPNEDWYLTALKTSQDIRTPAFLDWVHVGLQFQTVHHMFPRLPRHNLRIAQAMCKKVAADYFSDSSLTTFQRTEPYCEESFVQANAKLWRVLKRTATESTKWVSPCTVRGIE